MVVEDSARGKVYWFNYNSSGVFRLILREGEPGAFRNGTEMSSYKDIKIMS